MPQALHESSPALRYGGNSYSSLDSSQESSIYEELLRKRHPLDTLRQERFLLENEPLSESQINTHGFDIEDFVAAPDRYPSIERRKVVAIDCLWGRDKSRRLELLAISAIDFFSGETLISSLVAPPKLNLKWLGFNHGIGPAIKAIERGHECLQGWREARAKLFEYIDKETILIGHRTRDHLEALHLFHTQLIDSQILIASAVFKPSAKRQWHKWPLNKICRDFVGINIGQDAISKDQANWTFENVLASREIVIHYVQRPKDLEEWAKEARREYWKQIKDKKDVENVKKVKTNDHLAVSPATQANAIPILDERELLIAYNDGYEAGYQAAYQAGFESGFKTGYKRRYEQTNLQMEQTDTKNGGQEVSQWQEQQNSHESIQGMDEEEISSNRIYDVSQEDSPDPNSVWNENRPPPTPDPKKFTHEDLKKYETHMASRLDEDDVQRQDKLTDIDDDDDDWAPEAITCGDGTKTTVSHPDGISGRVAERAQDMTKSSIQDKPAPDTPMNQMAGAGSLLAHLMKDVMIEEMIQKVNQTQKETTGADEEEEESIKAQMKADVEYARALRIQEEKAEEESKRARIERKLTFLGSVNERVKGKSARSAKNTWNVGSSDW